MTSFYSDHELSLLGLRHCGKNVKLSRKTSLYSPEQIEIGDHARIDDFCILSGSIKLGRYIHVAGYCGLFGGEGIIMEDYSGISSRVTIYSVNDDYLGNGLTNPTVPAKYRHVTGGPVKLEKHVIIGAGTIILPGVTIGTGAAVGALSLVNADCEPWKIYTGNPARRRTDRKSEIILKYQADLEAEEEK